MIQVSSLPVAHLHTIERRIQLSKKLGSMNVHELNPKFLRVARPEKTQHRPITLGEMIEEGSLAREVLNPTTHSFIWSGNAQSRFLDSDAPESHKQRSGWGAVRTEEKLPKNNALPPRQFRP